MPSKKEIYKKLNEIYIQLLPLVLIFSSVSTTVVTFLSDNCTISPTIIGLTNSTMFENSVNVDSITGFSKSVVIVNTVFAFVMTLYGQYLKKARDELKANNATLTEQVDTLTMARRGSTQDILITPSEASIYPSATQVFIENEPIE